jgi:hypothetical protein
MNEQIEKLAEQCYETGPIGKDGWPEYSKFNYKKFADLIVRECAELAEECYCGDTVKSLIMNHFGIEL